jgi:hypothetical protein
MVLDGDLWRVGATVLQSDSPDDPMGRLRLLAMRCPPQIAIVRLSAAWVWHARDMIPQRIEVATTDGTRLASQHNSPYTTCDLRLGKNDVIRGEMAAVTSPSRTATDIARYETNLHEADVIEILRRLVRAHRRYFGTTDTIIDHVMSSKHLPYKERCLIRLNNAISERD